MSDPIAERRILRHAVLAGLCPLLPVPFVDDVLIGALRKRMIAGQLQGAGLELEPAQLSLVAFEPNLPRLTGCLLGLAWFVVKKLLRKLLYVFAIKDCVDSASRVLHHGWLFQHALDSGTLDASTFADGNAAIRRSRDAVRAATDAVDHRPLNQALRRVFAGSRSLVRGATRELGDALRAGGVRGRDAAAAERAVDGVGERDVSALERILDRTAEALGAHEGYRAALEAEYDRIWHETDPDLA